MDDTDELIARITADLALLAGRLKIAKEPAPAPAEAAPAKLMLTVEEACEAATVTRSVMFGLLKARDLASVKSGAGG